jgi:hypothetical protein
MNTQNTWHVFPTWPSGKKCTLSNINVLHEGAYMTIVWIEEEEKKRITLVLVITR